MLGIKGGAGGKCARSSAPIPTVVAAVAIVATDPPCVATTLAKTNFNINDLVKELPYDALKRLETNSEKYKATPTNDTAVRGYVDCLPDMIEMQVFLLKCV